MYQRYAHSAKRALVHSQPSVLQCRPRYEGTAWNIATAQGTVRTLYANAKSNFQQEGRALKKRTKSGPFSVLGVSSEEQYSAVKRNFLELAMKHHPDTSKARTKDEEAMSREIFIAAREAFEAIVEGPKGVAVLRTESDKKWEEEELNNWFRQESGGFDIPYMDPQSMKEVAEMTNTVGGQGGLDRDGGMWTLARMITQNVETGGDGSAILQLEAGAERDRQINGILRRKRRR